jgi:hypothetical protein
MLGQWPPPGIEPGIEAASSVRFSRRVKCSKRSQPTLEAVDEPKRDTEKQVREGPQRQVTTWTAKAQEVRACAGATVAGLARPGRAPLASSGAERHLTYNPVVIYIRSI